mmetsp:Transcript_115290/g.322264  ORF Transcript_115290/g.322264 Transcript_115290/m.322264 type:complete len:216 (+) Transcript_115290:695-1342(+)
MEPLHWQGVISGSSSPGPSSRQIRQRVVDKSAPVFGSLASALAKTVPDSSSFSSGCCPPQAAATSCRTRNLKRPSFMMSPSARRWPQAASSRTTSQSFFELLEGEARSTQKAPSFCTSRSSGSPPGGIDSRSFNICTSVPVRTNTVDFPTQKVWLCMCCASKSKRSWESRAHVLETTCTACETWAGPIRAAIAIAGALWLGRARARAGRGASAAL